MKKKNRFSATNTQGGSGVKRRMPLLKITCKYGGGKGSVMFWGCFSFKDTGNLVKVHGIMNSNKYQEILNLNLAAPARKTKTGSLLDRPSRIMIQNMHPNQHKNG